MPTVNWYRQTALGGPAGDRRFRCQGINLGSTEALRAVRVYLAASITVFGDATPLPPNFPNLAVSVAFGPNLSTPPSGDVLTNATGEDWFAHWLCENKVLARSTNNTVNAWEYYIILKGAPVRHCPRIATGASTSIWAVTSTLSPQGTAPNDWQIRLGLEYLSFIP